MSAQPQSDASVLFHIAKHVSAVAMIELAKTSRGLPFRGEEIKDAIKLCQTLEEGYINYKAKEPVLSHLNELNLFRALIGTSVATPAVARPRRGPTASWSATMQ